MPADSDSFEAGSGILWKPAGLRPSRARTDRHPPSLRSPAKEGALRLWASPSPRGSAVAGRESCVPGLAERALSGRLSSGTALGAPDVDGPGSARSRPVPQLLSPPARPRPSPYRGVGAAEQADHQQEDPPAGVGAVASARSGPRVAGAGL